MALVFDPVVGQKTTLMIEKLVFNSPKPCISHHDSLSCVCWLQDRMWHSIFVAEKESIGSRCDDAFCLSGFPFHLRVVVECWTLIFFWIKVLWTLKLVRFICLYVMEKMKDRFYIQIFFLFWSLKSTRSTKLQCVAWSRS